MAYKIKNPKIKEKNKEEVQIIDSGNGKYAILYTFEIGNSGEYEQRITNTNLSKTQALELKRKIEDKSIYNV